MKTMSTTPLRGVKFYHVVQFVKVNFDELVFSGLSGQVQPNIISTYISQMPNTYEVKANYITVTIIAALVKK